MVTHPTFTMVSALFFPMGWGSGEHPGISPYFTPKPTGLEGEEFTA